MGSSFKGKVIAITGGASGIGLEIARILHERGAKVSIADRAEAALATVASKIGAAEEEILTIRADVSDIIEIRSWLQETVEKFGKLDGAVSFVAGMCSHSANPLITMKANFAGIIPPTSQEARRLHETDDDEWRLVLGINLDGLRNCMVEEVKQFIKVGTGGSIVNAASVAGIRGLPRNGSYSVSKHGVVGLTRVGAAEYGQDGIRVNAVAPGYIDTPMLANAMGTDNTDWVDGLAQQTPLQRKAQPEEVAKVVVFLLSDESSYMTGSIVTVDAGWTL